MRFHFDSARRLANTPPVAALLGPLLAALFVLSGCTTVDTPTIVAAAEIQMSPARAELLATTPIARHPFIEGRNDFAIFEPWVDTNVWQRVRRGFVMADMTSTQVQAQELWYANRPDYIKRFVERGSRYMYHIIEEVERRGLPTEVVLLPIIESAFNPQAYSRSHASGMWQFIPSTGKHFGLKQDWLTDNRRDVLLSTNAALDYLTKLHGMFNSWELAFAAYNCGEGCVGRAIAANQRRGKPTDFASLNLPNETRAYVPKLIAVKNIILSPQSYGIDLPAVENSPYFVQVDAPEKIDVKLAARLAEMPEVEFAQLNPSFNKPVAATGTGYFLVPTEKADTFKSNLDLYQSLNGPMVSWITVKANRGQSVDAVARSHGMTTSYLRATNGPFKERKGKLTQPITFMAPNLKEAQAISETFDKKVSMKRGLSGSATMGDDGPTNIGIVNRENLRLASVVPGKVIAALTVTAVASVAAVVPTSQTSVTAGHVTYTVAKGDTLFSIARRGDIALDDLKTLNQLTGNSVKIGQLLQVPNIAQMTAQPEWAQADAPPTAASNNSAKATKNSGSSRIVSSGSASRIHMVRAGDTLFALAKQFNTSVANLLAWNKLSAKSALKTGMRLKVSP